MSRTLLVAIAAGGSVLLLLGAFGFQHLGELAPCPMCLWQRWPHAVAIVAGLLAFLVPGRVFPALGALAALTTAGIGAYHTGVERKWWEGPKTCSSASPGDLTADELFDQIMNAPLIRCDEVAWAFAGLSMPSWNAIFSLALFAVWVLAARKTISAS